MSGIFVVLILPLIGQIGDKVPSKVVIPAAFAFRSIIGMTFIWNNNPASTVSQAMCSLLMIGTLIECISIEVLLMRNMPNQIRGTMMGMFNFFSQVGVLLFTLIGG